MNNRVAIYARYSTDRQDGRSIEDQVRRCREYAKQHGFEVAAEYSDAAVSGSHTQREQYQQMLQAATSKSRPFRAILVDDLSRLSRDMGNVWTTVFGDLASSGVTVYAVSAGLGSDDPNAQLTFGAQSLVNQMFLQMVRTQTHRGLEGRALAGFSTGGRVYGYTSVVEANPPDPIHPRRILVVDEAEAAIVRRIFELYIGGAAYKSIADTLNREGVRAPHDNGRGHKNNRGWGHSTIRAVLRNERYIGRWTWNTSQWRSVSGKKQRRRVRREEREHVRKEMPSLAIIDASTWSAAQARMRRQYKSTGGRPAGSGSHGPYVTSGLLRCGLCAGSMSIVGAKVKNGKRYATFGCQTHHSRGAAICPNDLTISERKITVSVVSAVVRFLRRPKTVDRIAHEVARLLAEPQTTPDLENAEAIVRKAESRVRNVTEALAATGMTPVILEQLRAEQARLDAAKSDLARRRTQTAPVSIPNRDEVARYIENLVDALNTDPARGRELLVTHIQPVVLTPKGESPKRHYVGAGAFVFLGEQVLENVSSGGRI